MAVHDRAAFVAISSRLIVELDDHLPEVEELIAHWLDMEKYLRLSAAIDRMGRYCHAVPQLVGPWADVLITHTELIHCAWETAAGQCAVATDPAVQAALKVLAEALVRAREAALWVAENKGRAR
ncbi:hypothetical protein FN976_01125 [Caenimonas sedimenti]|uniref:Uncharacterized protein n=1 Tax=Caenimonas sedimenti TaxID=2596921 RepID=A0A562ZWY4_9BURK|nr:hypothetical protein [Caenimonas sedimenti]TWO72877.1 hypothetical protein FN976_01125 [Caenimonas sedimenti]